MRTRKKSYGSGSKAGRPPGQMKRFLTAMEVNLPWFGEVEFLIAIFV